MRYIWGSILCAVVLIGVVIGMFWRPGVESESDSPRPKLVVLFVFDQMRGDYLKKWQPLFGEGGFKRLQSEGAWFTNCHYPYAYTLTAAGHTSLLTGTSPFKHGIIANDWYDRAQRESVSSVAPTPEEITKGVGPHRRRSETVGDVLLRVLAGKSRVASLSIKDRAAILMAALRAQICYWFNTQTGNFGTTPYYRPDPHSWVTKFNKGRPADRWLDKAWDRFDKQLDYVKHSGPDDFVSEGTGYRQGQTFPHPFQHGTTKDKLKNIENYYNAVTNSPMGNELLSEFAHAAIIDEGLGQMNGVDLLCVSFSSNDLIGHCWGPDSQEVLDVTLRADVIIKNMLDLLDEKVGKGKYYFALAADHGVCPLPEFSVKQGKTADRVEPDILTTQVEEFLNKEFPSAVEGKKTPWLETPRKENPWIYFNQATLKERGIEQEKVERALADWFNTQPGVERAFTRSEMIEGKDENPKEQHKFLASVRRSFHPECSGDVMVILKEYHLFSSPTLTKNPEKYTSYRTSHGTPHAYDTHIPLLIMGPRIESGERGDPIEPQVMASILAEAMSIPRPKDAEYNVPSGLFKK